MSFGKLSYFTHLILTLKCIELGSHSQSADIFNTQVEQLTNIVILSQYVSIVNEHQFSSFCLVVVKTSKNPFPISNHDSCMFEHPLN